jgi:hypothetical protein
MQHKLSMLIVRVLAAFVLASCGGGSGNGSSSSSGGPVVIAAPAITTQPTARSVLSGRAVTFEVTATGGGTLSYQWLRNGADITGATLPAYTIGAASLTDDNASFSVKVSNGGGTVTSTAASLTVSVAGSVTVQTGIFVASALSSSAMGTRGGTLSVTSANDPLAGAKIGFPNGAVAQAVSVTLSSAPVTSITGLPDGAATRSRLIRLDIKLASDGSSLGELRRAVSVTLPLDGTTSDSVGFYKIDADGVLEPMGTDAADTVSRTLTFNTRAPGLASAAVAKPASNTARALSVMPLGLGATLTYSAYVAVGISQTTLAALSTNGASIDTGFRPSVNGFYIPNYGSYYRDSRNGNCFGMVGLAKYYFQQAYTPGLASKYRDAASTVTWVDDTVAIELASRIHNAMSDIWADYNSQEFPVQATSASGVARSLIGALYITRRPALVYISQLVGSTLSGAHAVSVHRVDIQSGGGAVFHTYDPNYPRDDSRRINWSPTTGFQTYLSGTTAADSGFNYNYFRHMGFYVGLTPVQLEGSKQEADQGYPASLFPKVTITAVYGKTLADNALSNTITTAQGQPGYRTLDRAVVIEGTVLGGDAQVAGQVVNNLNLFAPTGNLTTFIDNRAGGGTGRFSIVVPVRAGVNQIALMASKPNTVSQWAAFKEILVESAAAPSNFTVTLSWSRDTSDVDLYVKEPDGVAGSASAGKVGDIVYYDNRKGVSTTNAYLDFDNTSGFGPEHYFGRQGLLTKYTDGTNASSAVGTYTARVHYFGWSGASSADKTIAWTVNWRYLTACKNGCTNPEVDGLWTSGTRTGSLVAPNSSADGSSGFYASDASWSDGWNITVPIPQTTWTVPPSNTVMLP